MIMYEQSDILELNYFLSAFDPNLTSFRKANSTLLVAIHDVSISMIDLGLINSTRLGAINTCIICDENKEDYIIQAKVFEFQELLLLVVRTFKLVKIYQMDSLNLIAIFEQALDNETAAINDPFIMSKGLAASKNSIFCGHSSGSLIRFFVSTETSKAIVKHGLPLMICDNSITDLDANNSYMATGDVAGKITICNIRDDNVLQFWTRFTRSTGTPITCVKLVDQRLMSGKSSGIISIYDIPSKQLLAEITAHSRCISWLDISFHRDLMLSYGEDLMVRIWNLKSDSSSCVDFNSSFKCVNSLPFGAVFLNDSGTTIAIAGYDCDKIYCYKKKVD